MLKYNLLLYLISPYILIRLFFNTIKTKSNLGFFINRLGYNINPISGKLVWFHAASVGETKIALALCNELRKKGFHDKLLVTTNTQSSKNIINNSKIENLYHCYLPIDFYFATKRFFKYLNPRICIIIETEIWPNLISMCKKHAIPSIIVNARLSKRTTDGNIFKDIYKYTLSNINEILCKSEKEKEKYIKLGSEKEKIKVLGNLKFINNISKNEHINLIERKYILAASTHHDEELQIIKEWLKLKNQKILLVVAPRHPERLGDILAQLPLSAINISIRSKAEKIRKDTQIYIADTFGELDDLIYFSEFVFMGGSLIDHGGQNFIEAAKYGKTIVVGPFMYNFIDETEEFLKKSALLMIKNSDMIKPTFDKLLRSKNKREQIGKNAKIIAESKNNILKDYCKIIESYLN